MTLEERIAVLRAVPELEGLPGAAQGAMAAAMGEERFAAGETIIGAGAPADRVFVLCRGTADVRPAGLGSVRQLGRGALLGEIAFLLEGVRTATVVAASDCELLSLPFANLRALLLAHPRGALAMAASAARRMVESEARLAAGRP